MTLQAQRGPGGSLLLDLDTCGLYQIDAPALVALLRDGMQVPICPTEFSSEDREIAAGHAVISYLREAVWITHYKTGHRFVVPAEWLLALVAGEEQTIELREIVTP